MKQKFTVEKITWEDQSWYHGPAQGVTMTGEEASDKLAYAVFAGEHVIRSDEKEYIDGLVSTIRQELAALREKCDSFQAQYDHCVDHYTSINRELNNEKAALRAEVDLAKEVNKGLIRQNATLLATSREQSQKATLNFSDCRTDVVPWMDNIEPVVGKQPPPEQPQAEPDGYVAINPKGDYAFSKTEGGKIIYTVENNAWIGVKRGTGNSKKADVENGWRVVPVKLVKVEE